MPRQSATGGMPDFTGYVVDKGRYLLDKLLGSGAYGKVYRALDLTSPSNNRTYCAIKCMPIHDPGSTKGEFQRRELVHHPMLQGHPNIVHFERTFRDDDWMYIVMELVEGGDLFGAITERQIFQNNDQLVKKIYLQIIDALRHCHNKGIFHRDIKPENILWSETSQSIKLADFGLSTRSTASAEYGCGSCYYMSPECIGEQKPRLMYSSKQTDIWSMGVILVNMISGRNPWRYATMDDACYLAFIRDRDFLGNVLPISAEANAIIKSVFTLDPFERITLEELRDRIVNITTFFRTKPAETKPVSNTRSVEVIADSDPRTPFHDCDSEYDCRSPVDESLQPDTEQNLLCPIDQPAGPGAFIPGIRSKPDIATSSGNDSSKSSLAVKTPSVHAVDRVAVARPGIGQEEDMVSLALPGSIVDRDLHSTGTKAKSVKIKSSRNIIRAAVQRIKDFSAYPNQGNGA